MLDVQGPFGFEEVTETAATQLCQRLCSQESRTWNDIFGSDQSHNHGNRTDRFSPRAQKRLRELQLDDFDELHSIRLSGVGRLYGVLREGVFYVVWWDRHHAVYPSKKKRT